MGLGEGEARSGKAVLFHFALPKQKGSAQRKYLYGCTEEDMEKADAAREDWPVSTCLPRLHLQIYSKIPTANLGGIKATLCQDPGSACQGIMVALATAEDSPPAPQPWATLTLWI